MLSPQPSSLWPVPWAIAQSLSKHRFRDAAVVSRQSSAAPGGRGAAQSWASASCLPRPLELAAPGAAAASCSSCSFSSTQPGAQPGGQPRSMFFAEGIGTGASHNKCNERGGVFNKTADGGGCSPACPLPVNTPPFPRMSERAFPCPLPTPSSSSALQPSMFFSAFSAFSLQAASALRLRSMDPQS